ncbi:MAG: NfeD family protein [Spirochaetaceae bacterium]|jgi:membrane protein implicated in regulation of membrane protease activity|nr:NfeD family protein [Spirochaetaceae bacterium]
MPDVQNFLFTPWFWLAMTILFSVIELVSAFNLITIWFALSSLIMLFVAGITESFDFSLKLKIHTGLFLAVSGLLLAFTRPLLIKKLKVGREKTNVHALIGQSALVTKKIAPFCTGEVKVRGQLWTAFAENNAVIIEEGAECVIVRIEGVKAAVQPPAQEHVQEQRET